MEWFHSPLGDSSADTSLLLMSWAVRENVLEVKMAGPPGGWLLFEFTATDE